MAKGVFSNASVWRVLLLMGDGRSLTVAAQETGQELSSASKAISRLEEGLGVALVDRHQRPVRLTREALRLLPHMRELAAAQQAIASEARRMRRAARAVIRVSLPPGSFNQNKVRAFRAYETAHPGVRIEAKAGYGHEALLRGEIDVAAVSYRLEHDELAVFPLGVCANLPLASPEYLARRGTPHEPEELTGHTLLLVRRSHVPLCETLYRADEAFSLTQMRRFRLAAASPADRPVRLLEQIPVQTAPQCVISSYSPTLMSALQGQGIAVDLALGMAADRLKNGELVAVLDGWHRQSWRKSLVVRRRDLQEKPWIRDFAGWYRNFDPAHSRRQWTRWYRHFGVGLSCVRPELEC